MSPYRTTVPARETQCVLYTTKPESVVAALDQEGSTRMIQVIGRAGLPNEEDVPWLRNLSNTMPVAYLGDCDPVDLLVFACLNPQLAMSYVGICDSLFEDLHKPIDDHLTIPLSLSEIESLALLTEVCPDCGQLVGANCADTLKRRRKIELEAAVLGCDRILFEKAVIRKTRNQ